MKVAGFIANRIAFNQQRSISRFIIRLSIVATVISVAVMIVTLAFANGFQRTVSEKVFSFWGHIRIQEKQPYKALIAEEIPIEAYPELVQQVKQNPAVKTIAPFATKYAILKSGEQIEGVLLKGIDKNYDFNNLQRFMQSGRAVQFNDSTYSREIMLSAYTAEQLHLKINDGLLIYFIKPDGSIRPDKLTITGIYKTGIEDYDKTFAIGDLRLIQRLNEWSPEQIGGYEIFTDNYKNAEEVADEIYEIGDFPATWESESTKTVSPNIFDWLNMQDTTRNVLIGFMVVVAVINLITCLIILVLERVRMIGVLKALGATDWTIQKIFLRHSLLITFVGILVGAIVGLGILYLQIYTGFITLPEDAYYMDKAAVHIIWWEVLLICVLTLLVCMLILMIPSLIVRKVQPVRAIQFR